MRLDLERLRRTGGNWEGDGKEGRPEDVAVWRKWTEQRPVEAEMVRQWSCRALCVSRGVKLRCRLVRWVSALCVGSAWKNCRVVEGKTRAGGGALCVG